MQEIKFKIKDTEFANVEIVPVGDGVEIIVHYGSNSEKSGSFEKQPKQGKFNPKAKSPQEVIEDMKADAREEYKKPGADKKEIKKFVDFWERKIEENGWKGEFKFDVLYERWLENKR